MEVGGVILIKESNQLENYTEFDNQLQQFIRPKSTYFKILNDYDSQNSRSTRTPTEIQPRIEEREFILVSWKNRDINATD
jgi:hypothetical protein